MLLLSKHLLVPAVVRLYFMLLDHDYLGACTAGWRIGWHTARPSATATLVAGSGVLRARDDNLLLLRFYLVLLGAAAILNRFRLE